MSVDRSRNLEIILHMSVAHFEKKKKKQPKNCLKANQCKGNINVQRCKCNKFELWPI